MQKYETVSDFCKRVGVSVRAFYRLKAAGAGPIVTRIGGRNLISETDSAEYLACCRVLPLEGKRAA